MRYDVTLAGVTRSVEVQRDGEGWRVQVGDAEPVRITGTRSDPASWRLRPEGGAAQGVGVALDRDQVFVLVGALPLQGQVVDPRAAALTDADAGGHGAIATQMPGAVVRLLVAEGDVVVAGQVLVVVEAMKMENEFKAPFDGTVERVPVAVGQAVEAGTVLVELNPA